jgi:hypothetical protein
MIKEDWIILRLLKTHKIIDIHNFEDCTKASLYLKEKYGVKQIIKNWNILDKELNDKIQTIIDKQTKRLGVK